MLEKLLVKSKGIQMKSNKKYLKIAGYMMFVSGFILLLMDAANYLFKLQVHSTTLPFGVTMVCIGALFIQQSRVPK